MKFDNIHFYRFLNEAIRQIVYNILFGDYNILLTYYNHYTLEQKINYYTAV